MPIKLTDLIARVPREVEARVRRMRDQARPTIQDALRAECRLEFRTPEEMVQNLPGAKAPVGIAEGYPAVLHKIDFPDDFERVILLGRYRAVLEQAVRSTSGLVELRRQLLRQPAPEKWVLADEAALEAVAQWASALLRVLNQQDPLTKVLAVQEDVLGVYEYDARDLFRDERAVNRATIRLYWGVIGLVSEWLGCSVEDLTVVVLTHELAHAFTQLGADIEGRRWPSPAFAAAETALKEGLAQYYTDRVLRRIGRRYGGALGVFEAMLPRQSEPYRAHQTWEQSSPEAVRRAMLEIRRWKQGKIEDFERRLAVAGNELDPEAAAPF